MGKFTKTIQHDYMRFKAKFADERGGTVSGNYSRNGHTVTLEPYEPELARKVSDVFTNVDSAVKKGVFNLGHFFEVVEPAATAANSVDGFLSAMANGLRERFGVDVERHIDLVVREATVVTVGKKGRSATLEVKFENGEDVYLSVAGRSVGFRMVPDQTLFASKLSSMVLGLASMTEASQMPELVNRLKEAAEASPDVETWIENIRSGPKADAAPSGPRP